MKGKVVAIIPVRSGSKGVKDKNLSVVGRKSLMLRAIDTCKKVNLVDEVIVSSDSDDYLDIASSMGALTVKRPRELAADDASSESAILHCLSKFDQLPDFVVFYQATSPFVQPEYIYRALESVKRGDFDVVFSAFETFGFLWSKSVSGEATGINHDFSARPRRQDREPHYMETGAFYVLNTQGFLKAKHRFFGKIGIEVVPEHSAIDIDTHEDLDVARVLATYFDSRPDAIDVDALVMDFDGVHTENSAWISQSGEEQVRVSRSDGFGLEQLRKAGIPMLILSKERNPVVSARGIKLGIPVLQGVEDKAEALTNWLRENHLNPARTAYVGNDVNDIECFNIVGMPIAVADAEIEVRMLARVVMNNSGGNGALREVSRMILRGKKLD
jgi:N-acylneuraminate cytidylyltransferase